MKVQQTSTTVNRLDLDIVRKESRRTGTYLAALVATASLLPLFAGVISVVAYVTQWSKGLPSWISLLLGSLPVLIIWLLFAVPYRRFTAVNHAESRSYKFLLNRLQQLDVRLQLLDFELEIESGDLPAGMAMQGKSTETSETEYKMSPSGDSLMPMLGRIEVLVYRNAIYDELKSKNISWMLSTGYINLWGLVQLAEEALIEVSPRATVIRGALYDKACIQHSHMSNRNELLDKLMQAIRMLEAIARDNFKQSSLDLRLLTQEDRSSLPAAGEDAAEEAQARAILRAVRHILNQFQNSRWEALVHMRNLLICTMVLAGLILYILLEIIITSIPPFAITVAMLFFVVGAMVGLFIGLSRELQISTSIDDYGLTTARLVVTPIFSGIAAIGGVLVLQQFSSMVNLFDLKHLPMGLLVAAPCGIIPNLFMNALQKQAEQYKADLKSTQATELPQQGEGLLSVHAPRSFLSRIAYGRSERGVSRKSMDASQLPLLAIARANLEQDKRAFAGKTYPVDAGISPGFQITIEGPAEPIPFDIIVHTGEHVELMGDWYQRLLYDPTNPDPQITTFQFKVSKPGQSNLFINFYRERQWLRTIHLEFDAVEHSVPS